MGGILGCACKGTRLAMLRIVLAMLVNAICLVGCTRAPVSWSGPDAGKTPNLDIGVASDSFVRPDMPCRCQSGHAVVLGHCAATAALGTCAKICSAGAAYPCPSGMLCSHHAWEERCITAVGVPICLPDHARSFVPGTLRIAPSSGSAGKEVELAIRGGFFHQSLKHWVAEVGGFKTGLTRSNYPCNHLLRFTPPKPGIYTVTVRYPGNNECRAGFFLATGGAAPHRWVQPGFPCWPGDTCVQKSPYMCSCQGGRCRCARK